MGLPSKLLSAGEHEVIHTRTHAKALVLPALGFVVAAVLVGGGAALVPSGWRPAGQLAVAAVGVVLVVWWSLIPFLRWRTTTYTVTNRRLITRWGILNHNSQELPLSRVNDVASERSLSDRVFGCGTLNVQTAAEGGTLVLRDVPDVEHVHAEISELLFGTAPQA